MCYCGVVSCALCVIVVHVDARLGYEWPFLLYLYEDTSSSGIPYLEDEDTASFHPIESIEVVCSILDSLGSLGYEWPFLLSLVIYMCIYAKLGYSCL